jgi:Carboxypeptidase regulatory-like domain
MLDSNRRLRKSPRARVSKALYLLTAAIAVVFISLPLLSQSNQGRISGGVFDQTGGAIAGANVSVTDVARGVARPLTTDSAGEYSASGLLPGTYTVRAEAKGFKTV